MQALASRRRLGTCEKTVFCCERHALCATPVNVLFFSLHYVNLTIPKRRETTFPFPAWDARNHWSKIPSARLVDTPNPGYTGRTCRPTFSWNPSLSGTGLTTSLWRAACFPDMNVAVLFAPSHPAPLAQSSSSNADTSLSSTFGSELVLSFPSSLREQTSRVACPGCLLPPGRTSREGRCSGCSVACETACDALPSSCRQTSTRTGHLLPFIRPRIGNGMSRASS